LPKEIIPAAGLPTEGRLYEREFEAFQRSLFDRTLRETGGNKAEAARRLGWHPVAFRRRCTELGSE
jgi:DNA-binding NtrC family response regulator